MKDRSSEKLYFKIQDVAEMIGVNQSTLRFWEKEFEELNPKRSKTKIRYYSPEDLELLNIIYFLVKTRGLKIEAARQQLRTNRRNVSKRIRIIESLKEVRDDLKNILAALEKRTD